ncbi:pilin [Achromobacter xylosoxidans]|uniref:pilin n=1 Tax=Alcaligenes xylosoxydans xylosoxydans TaxID=85698 RepID=UPI0013013F8E|nr:pilin [Achromobacter xylosoxidans]
MNNTELKRIVVKKEENDKNKISEKTSYSNAKELSQKGSYSDAFRKISKGFTVIELMITVAIIGVLSAVAIPAYQDYVTRSQVSEAVLLGSGAKPAIAEYYANNGEYPANNNSIGYDGAVGNFVESINIQDGNIVVRFNDKANKQLINKMVVLSPLDGGQEIVIAKSSFILNLLGINDALASNESWNCYANIEQKYLPKQCETREFSSSNPENPGNEEETNNSIELWKDAENSYLIEEDKPYVIKDFNNLPRAQLGSLLDISRFTNGSLDNVVFERDGANTIVRIGDSKNTITIENVDMSNDGQLDNEQIKHYQLVRGKLKF